MKVLALASGYSTITAILCAHGDDVVVSSQRLTHAFINKHRPDFIVVYGYSFIIGKEFVALYRDRVINLHISYLPWNRGAEPVFWSFLNATPKGVTIHYVDEGIDSGDIIIRKETGYSTADTLNTHYKNLHVEMLKLFDDNWEKIKRGDCERIPQKELIAKRSLHLQKDMEEYFFLIKENGYDTPVEKIVRYGRNLRI